MSTSCNLFLLNPLTTIFLSGVATQIIFIIYCNSPLTGKNIVQYRNSQRRIDTWQQMFEDYCNEYYSKHSEAYEKAQFVSKNILDPFIVHSNLLIKYSTIILHLCQKQKIGNETKKTVNNWFILIMRCTNSNHWLKHCIQQNINILHSLHQKFASVNDEDLGCDKGKDFMDFNPLALFIRSAFIVKIHHTYFSTNTTFTAWEHCIWCILSEYIHIQVYINEFSEKSRQLYFSPEFPLINHLPCRQFYDMLNDSAKQRSIIPIHKIYNLILQLINGKLMTLHYFQRHQFNLPSMNENTNLQIFIQFCKKINGSMEIIVKKLQNNEKQKKHQLLKFPNCVQNNYNAYPNNFFNFIFGLNVYSCQGPLKLRFKHEAQKQSAKVSC